MPVFVNEAPDPMIPDDPKVTLGVLGLIGDWAACQVAATELVAVGTYPAEGVPVRVTLGGILTAVKT